MKAVIVEKHDGFAVALREDGCFVRVKGSSFEIGREVTLKSGTTGMVRKIVAAVAAFAVLVTAGGVGTNVYFAKEVYSVVSVDINPSIEYSLNRFDKVVSVRGVNSEGEQIAGEISDAVVKGNLSNALYTTVECLRDNSYITEDEANYMVISVYSKSVKKQESIGVAVAAFSNAEMELCTVTTINVSKEEKEVADNLGITAGKMILANEAAEALGEDAADIDISELAALSVEELTNIASGKNESEKTGSDAEEVCDNTQKEEPVVTVSGDEAAVAVSDDDIAEVVSGDDVEIASEEGDDGSEVDVSDSKSDTESSEVSTSKTETPVVTVSGDEAESGSDVDESSSKKDDEETSVVSGDTAEDTSDDDSDADAVSTSKKGDSTDVSAEDGEGDDEAEASKPSDESVSVSKPKSSQFSRTFESGNNISISDTEKTDNPKI